MWFWTFMFVCNLLIPILLLVFGRVMLKHPPKKRNGIYGYRTSMSMKNMDTWNFAHGFCGKIWWRVGWILLAASVLIQLPFIKSSEAVVGTVGGILCTVQCVCIILTILPVEKALKAKFNPDGTEK